MRVDTDTHTDTDIHARARARAHGIRVTQVGGTAIQTGCGEEELGATRAKTAVSSAQTVRQDSGRFVTFPRHKSKMLQPKYGQHDLGRGAQHGGEAAQRGCTALRARESPAGKQKAAGRVQHALCRTRSGAPKQQCGDRKREHRRAAT